MPATYEETVRLLERRASSERREDQRTPGILASLARGLAKSPVFRVPVSDAEVPSKPGFEAPPSAMTDERYEQLRRERFGPPPNHVEIRPPETLGERAAHRVGESLPIIAGGALLGAPAVATASGMSVPAALATEMAVGTAATGVGATVEEATGSPAAGITAELASGGMLVNPLRVTRNVRRAVVSGSEGAAQTLAERLTAKLGIPVDAETAARAASELKRKLARGVDEPEKYIDRSIDKLGQAIGDFDDVTPSMGQVLSEEGGENLASLELSYARADQDYAREALGRRLDVREKLADDFEAARPKGTVGGLLDAYHEAQAEAIRAERTAWGAVPMAEIPRIDTTGLKRAVAELRGGPKASRQYIPNEASVIDEFYGAEPITEIQALRSELLDTQRAAARFGASDELRRKAKRVQPLLDAIQDELDKLPEMSGGHYRAASEAYQAARRATAENRSRFSRSSSAVRALEERTDPKSIVGAIRNAKDPAGEARRIVGIVSDQEGGLDDLRSIFVDDLFGEALGDKTARAMSNAIERKRDVYVEVFGEDGVRFLEEIVRRQRIAMTGKAGTAAQAHSTGTGQAAIDQLLSLATDARSPMWATASKFARYVSNKALSRDEIVTLIRMATQDIRLAKVLLELPTPAAEPAWRIVFDQAANRAKTHTARVAARNTAARAGDREVPSEGR